MQIKKIVIGELFVMVVLMMDCQWHVAYLTIGNLDG